METKILGMKTRLEYKPRNKCNSAVSLRGVSTDNRWFWETLFSFDCSPGICLVLFRESFSSVYLPWLQTAISWISISFFEDCHSLFLLWSLCGLLFYYLLTRPLCSAAISLPSILAISRCISVLFISILDSQVHHPEYTRAWFISPEDMRRHPTREQNYTPTILLQSKTTFLTQESKCCSESRSFDSERFFHDIS